MSTRIVLVVYVLILVAAAGFFVVFWLIRLAFWCGWRFILVLLRLFVLLLLLFCCLQQFLNGFIQRILFGGGVKFLKSTFAFVAIWDKPVGFSDEEGKEGKAQQKMKWVSVMKQGYAECCVTWFKQFILYDTLLLWGCYFCMIINMNEHAVRTETKCPPSSSNAFVSYVVICMH